MAHSLQSNPLYYWCFAGVLLESHCIVKRSQRLDPRLGKEEDDCFFSGGDEGRFDDLNTPRDDTVLVLVVVVVVTDGTELVLKS